MAYKRKKLKIEKYKNVQTIVFITSVAVLGIITVISLNIAINHGKITLNTKLKDEYALAIEAFNDKNYNKAKYILEREKSLSIDPKRQYDASILLGKVYNEIGDYEEAITLFNSLANSIYAGASIKHNIGISYMRKGVFDDAIENFEKALHIDSNYVPTLIMLGNFYMTRNLPRLAKGYYERVLSIEDNDEAMLNLGIIALDEGFQSLAYNILNRLVKKSKSAYADKAASLLGDIYVISGDTDSAIEMYLKSLANSSVQQQSVKRLVDIYEKNEDYDGIKKIYQQILEQKPEDTEALLALGNIYEKEDLYDKSIIYYLKLTKVKDYTNMYETINLLANSYYKDSRLKEASANYKKLLATGKNDDIYKTALERLGDITYKQKYFASSLKYYQEFYNIETNNAIFMPRLGELELYYGNPDRGIKLLKDSIKDDIGKAFPSRTLAIYYENTGNTVEAINYYKLALSKYPNDRESIFRIGMIYYKIKEYNSAKDSLLISANDENNTVLVRERAWITLATMSEEIRAYNDALSCYRYLVELRPTVENYMVYGAFSYRRLQYSDAINAYKLALENKPPKRIIFDIYLALGKCYFRLNDLENAEINYRKALDYNRNDIQAQEGLRQVLTKKDLMYRS